MDSAQICHLSTQPGIKFEQIIPDEILAEILRLVPIKCRIRCSSTCKRWRRLLTYADHLGSLRVTEFPIKKDPTRIYNHIKFSSNTIENVLKTVLPKVGSVLKSLSLGDVCTWEMRSRHFDLIAEFAPQITSLSLMSIYGSERSDFNIPKLRQLSKLSSFAIDASFTYGYLDDEDEYVEANKFASDLSNLFANWPLESLEIRGCEVSLEIVCSKLVRLTLWDSYLSDSQLAQLCAASKNITSLSLGKITGVTDFSLIAQLHSLVRLEFRDVPLTSLHLKEICQNCTELNHLELVEIETVSDIRWLRHFKKVKCLLLNISTCDTFVDDLPENLPIEDLTILAIIDDEYESKEVVRLTNEGLIELRRKTPLLKRFKLHYAAGVTNVLLDHLWSNLDFIELFQVGGVTGDGWFSIGQSPTLRNVVIDAGDSDGLWPLALGRLQSRISTPMVVKTFMQCSDLLRNALEKMNVRVCPPY